VRGTPEKFMRAALGLAGRGLGHTSPNPAVGAVVVKGDKVIARGWHRRAGLPHAEVQALRKAARRARGADLYVTLEPCCHLGRTPPCTKEIIGAGLKRVFIGILDPNPRVKGKGIRELKRAGIEVRTGFLEDSCRTLNEAYIKYITTGSPFVTLKLAATIDGRIATSTGESRWITGVESRRLVHSMRSQADAVMVGSGTVIKDDPELTVRLSKGKSPLRVIVDTELKTPLSARVLSSSGGRVLIFVTKRAARGKIKKLEERGAEVIVVPFIGGGSGSGLSLRRVMEELGKREVTSLMVEGGSTLAASAIKQGVVDKVCFFISPMILGGDALPSIAALGIKNLGKGVKLGGVKTKRLGRDIMVEGYL
jgi:diaminohydroxyphosphoribosylaminopyrimidine deaminase/5-amino-6-(5-phosphoribosylamino)uracil reductase